MHLYGFYVQRYISEVRGELVSCLFAVISLDGYGRHVLPAEMFHHFHDCLGLEVIRWYDTTEIFKARLIRELGSCRGVADLRNLQSFAPKKTTQRKRLDSPQTH